MHRKIIALTTTILFAFAGYNAVGQDVVADTATIPPAAKPHGIIARIIDYFHQSNKKEITRHPDFSFIGGPHYSSDSKFGIGLVAAGAYSTDPENLDLTPSDISITADITTAGHFSLGVEGHHIKPDSRLEYIAEVSYIDTKYWGIGFDMNVDDANESKYKYLDVKASAIYSWALMRNFFVGPLVSGEYVGASHFEFPDDWAGLPTRMLRYGVGVALRYDTRDYITAATRGVYISFEQTFNWHWLGNRHGFNSNEFTAAWYHKLWRDASVATRIHSRFTWGDTPWAMLSTIGGSRDMRGYFYGRYRDKNEIDLTVELRQHLWRRNGVVVWGGVASVFPRFSDIRFKKLLPNYGFGYRWEFKKNMNVRIDVGFGRGQTGFIFNLNEAF